LYKLLRSATQTIGHLNWFSFEVSAKMLIC